MSEFDPENVERWGDSSAEEHHIWLEVVAAEDYDKLLALYRDAAGKGKVRKQLHWLLELTSKRKTKVSVRAFNVVYNSGMTAEEFFDSTPRELRLLRNCGMKSVIELATLARDAGKPLCYGVPIWDASHTQKAVLQVLCAND